MGLNIFYGVSGCGKSARAFDYAIDIVNKGGNVIYIVPEQYTHSQELEITKKLGVSSPLNIMVLSFSRLYYYTCNLLAKHDNILSNGIRQIIIGQCIKKSTNDLTILKGISKHTSFVDTMSDIISEFKRYNIGVDMLLNSLNTYEQKSSSFYLKLKDIATIYGLYEEKIANVSIDSDDALMSLNKMLISNMPYKDTTFIFDEFNHMTPSEVAVLKTICNTSKDVYMTVLCDQLSEPSNVFDVFFEQKRLIKNLNIDKSEKINKVYKDTELDFLNQALIGTRNDVYENTTQDISISKFKNPYDEITYIANEILTLTQNGFRFKDIGILTSKLDTYRDIIKSAFSARNINYFLDDTFELTKLKAAYLPVLALEIIKYNYNFESVFAYLKSGFSPLSDLECAYLEKFILATGVRGGNMYKNQFFYIPYSKDQNELEKINLIREKFIKPISFLQSQLESVSNATQMCQIMYDFLAGSEYYSILQQKIAYFSDKNPQISALLSQTQKILSDVFSDISVAFGEEKISLDDFINAIKASLASSNIAIIPNSTDSVTIGDLDRSKSKHPKVVFIIGATEGNFPLVSVAEGLLSDKDRNILKDIGINISEDTISKMFLANGMVYQSLCTATDKVYISYPLEDAIGSCVYACSTILELKEFFKNIKENDFTSKLPDFDYKYDSFLSLPNIVKSYKLEHNISKESNEKLNYFYKTDPACVEKINSLTDFKNQSSPVISPAFSKDIIATSVSQLQKYNGCPFAYFGRYMMRANPFTTPQLDRANEGEFLHRVVELFIAEVISQGNNWRTLSEDDACEKISRICDMLADEYDKKYIMVSARRKMALNRLKDTAKTSVMMIYHQLKSGEFIPIGVEIDFNDTNPCIIDFGGKMKVKINGKIDRADLYTDPEGKKYIRVIDYKSGSKKFSLSDIFFGIDFQLAVYLDHLCEREGALQGGMLYFRLIDPIGDLDEQDVDIVCKFKTDGVLINDPNVVLKMGDSAMLPVSYDKDGNLKKGVLTFNDFKDIKNKVHSNIQSVIKELKKGNVQITPAKMRDKCECDYCDYKDMCLFFDQTLGNQCRTIPKLKDDDVLEILRGERIKNALDK